MLTTALRTLRARWVTFVGSFVALALGVSLLTVMGLALAASADVPDRAPERFAAAPVVVKGQDTLRVPTPIGDRTHRLAHPRPLPTEAIARLERLGPVVPDRAFPVRAGSAQLVGHPWSIAAFTPYDLTAGRAPTAPHEVVVTSSGASPGASPDARPGDKLRTNVGTLHVVGTARPTSTATTTAGDTRRPFETALFFTDARAAEFSPAAPTQAVVDADPAAVRAALADRPGIQVLTGDARRLADADPDSDTEAVTALNALFGTAGGVTAFVSVFVVASTFAFAVAQRRREFGLLRTAGATPGQIRRMVAAEALLVGVLASAAGCVLGGYGAPWLGDRVVEAGLAPSWFTIGARSAPAWPYHLAFWTGLLVALLGVVAASWRAGRTGPTQALREASVDAGALTRGRLLCGTGLLLTAAVTLALALVGDPGELLHRKTYISRPMLLITAVALLSPAVVPPLTRLLVRLPGVTGMLVRENATAAVRRTAAVAAPVLVTVGLAGSLLGATETLDAAKSAETRARVTADFVVTPRGYAVLAPETRSRLRAVPGVAKVSATASTAVYVLEEGVALISSEARAAEPGPLAATARLPLAAGRVADLDDDSIIVNEEWERHRVGDTVRVWLGDGTRRSLRIAAVLRTGTGDNGVYVTPANAPGARVDRIDVRLAEGASAASAAAALRTAAGESARLLTTTEAPATTRATEATTTTRATETATTTATTTPNTTTPDTTRLGLLLVLGIALLYTAISLVNTMVMATSDRVGELAALRLAGATRAQTLRLVAVEALTVVAVGGVLGLLVAVLNLLGMRAALALLEVPAAVRLPWPELAVTVVGCAVLAVIASVAPAALALRRGAAAHGAVT
ncbi:ABC transporter permease [Streptomyces sp. NPDC001595]|uniref:ABC transporter permease n=1 Tax=Streptomyces sp. NPDC001532 TaxID=3154520 RepID=UPI0033231C2D